MNINRNRLSSFVAGLAAVLSVMFSTSLPAMFCSTDANLAIADGSGSDVPGATAVITIDVPAINEGTVTDLDFQLAINHTWIGDLIATLESPDGTIVTLIDRPGTPPGTFGCGRDDIDVVLDDEAATLAEDQCDGTPPALGGTHQPTGSLSDFDGDVIAGTWTLRVTDNANRDLGTIISANNCIDASTTPVTISSFETRMRGQLLQAKWQTSSEAFNLGFHLWGNVDGDWQQLNPRLIPSRSFDSVVPQRYKRNINLLKIEGDVTEVGISALSSDGQEDFFGPFAIGERYGEDTVPRYIDWGEQRRQYDLAMEKAGYRKLHKRWIKKTPRREKRLARQKQRYPDVIVEVKEQGIYRIRYEDLLEHGIDYHGLPINKLAVLRDGKAIPRLVTGSSERARRFGVGADITFFAQGPDTVSERYVDHARYRLSFDPKHVLVAPDLTKSSSNQRNANQPQLAPVRQEGNEQESLSDTHQQRIRFGEKNNYSYTLPNDGWYDSAIRAFGRTSSKIIDVTVPDTALIDHPVNVSLSLIGGLNFPQRDADGDGELEPNHHYRVYLNRAAYPDAIYEGFADGIAPIEMTVSIHGQLQHGVNHLEVELIPDNGYNIDVIYVAAGELSFTAPNTVSSGVLSFPVTTSQAIVQVEDANHVISAVYSTDGKANFSLQKMQRHGDTVRVVSPQNPALLSAPSLWFLADSMHLQPENLYLATPVNEAELDLSNVDYVVIADAALQGDDLQRFVARQIELGRRTKVVSAQAIYQRYADGLVVPQAIAAYLAEQAQHSPYQYVLLVGGHTYNYRGYQLPDDQRPITFIPSFYRAGGDYTQQIPTAVPFVDFDQDGAPDRAIGRWPVRDLAQLSNVVDKTLKWHADGSHKDQQSALFIADRKETRNDFVESSRRLARSLGLQLNPWSQPNTVFIDDVIADDSVNTDDKVRVTRDRIVEAVSQGPALTVYSGHAAPTLWGNQSLVNADVADRFTNSDAPSLMVPLACYTTYYETPNIRSLSDILLTGSQSGAVGLSGAALLSRAGDNERFGRRLLEEMTVTGLDLGSAVLKVKREMHRYSKRHQTIVYNWVSLADPTLSFALPNVQPEAPPEQSKGQ